MRRLLISLLVLSLALLGALPASAGTRARYGAGAWGDFNGDGYADLYVGVPFDEVGGNDNVGGVNVIYGGKRGTRPRGNQWWHQDRPRIKGDASRGSRASWRAATASAC
ncbi:MAG TPA: FG-GAP repeat protein [Actinomycetota bacterium]